MRRKTLDLGLSTLGKHVLISQIFKREETGSLWGCPRAIICGVGRVNYIWNKGRGDRVFLFSSAISGHWCLLKACALWNGYPQ